MKAVIVGASGFIGSHLVDGLLAKGYRVKALARSLPGLISPAAQNNPALTMISVDMANELALLDAMEGAELVFHLASGSLPQSSNRNPQADIQINLIGSLTVLEAARLANIKRLIFVSSGGTVYGVPRQVPIKESSPTDPTCSYGITKLAIEKYIFLYRQLHDLDGLVLRLANPYGDRQRLESSQGVVPVFLGKALRGEPLQIWGDGSVIRDFIYISDVVDALLAAAHYQGDERIFNVGSGQGLALNQLVACLESELGNPIAVKYMPSRGFDVPANILCIDRAKQCLGWSPQISVNEGIHKFRQALTG